jgi:tripartite-type tricarboxylate transporter receptor subunit TctC
MACAQTSTAPAFPARAVRLIVPFAPGGGADVLGRLFALKLGEAWGRPVVVENRTGAGGNVGAETTARAVADGHTAMLTTNSLAVNVTLYPKAGYSALTDLAPVALVARVPLVLVVHPSVPARSVRELVELARRRPGGINFGSNGSATSPACIWVNSRASASSTSRTRERVPYSPRCWRARWTWASWGRSVHSRT